MWLCWNGPVRTELLLLLLLLLLMLLFIKVY